MILFGRDYSDYYVVEIKTENFFKEEFIVYSVKHAIYIFGIKFYILTRNDEHAFESILKSLSKEDAIRQYKRKTREFIKSKTAKKI